MADDSFQLSGSAAAIYEEQKVPAIFAPLAEATLDRSPLVDGTDVLDVACGTGVLARKARERHGKLGRVVGADLNAGMIATAQSLTDPHSMACEWHVADASDMPFDDQLSVKRDAEIGQEGVDCGVRRKTEKGLHSRLFRAASDKIRRGSSSQDQIYRIDDD